MEKLDIGTVIHEAFHDSAKIAPATSRRYSSPSLPP